MRKLIASPFLYLGITIFAIGVIILAGPKDAEKMILSMVDGLEGMRE